MNNFDDKVKALALTELTKTVRPIKWISKDKYDDFEVGNVMYDLKEGEQIPILFMGAFKIKDWIICMECNTVTKTIMIGGFYKGESRCNFGPVEGYPQFFDFFNKKILTLYFLFEFFNFLVRNKLWMTF